MISVVGDVCDSLWLAENLEVVLCITCQGFMLLECCVSFSLNYFNCLNCLDAIEVCKNGNMVGDDWNSCVGLQVKT